MLKTTSAIGLLVMMYPILCKVQFEKLHEVFKTKEIWIQLGFSIIVNWIVAPLFMVRDNHHDNTACPHLVWPRPFSS